MPDIICKNCKGKFYWHNTFEREYCTNCIEKFKIAGRWIV